MLTILLATACVDRPKPVARSAADVCTGVAHITRHDGRETWMTARLDDLGRPVLHESWSDRDLTALSAVYEFEYDDAGNPIEERIYDGDRALLVSEHWTWRDGDVEIHELVDGEGISVYRETSTFDAAGLRTEMLIESYYNSGSVEFYDYDDHGRLVHTERNALTYEAVLSTIVTTYLRPAPSPDRIEVLDYGGAIYRQEAFFHDEDFQVVHQERIYPGSTPIVTDLTWTAAGKPETVMITGGMVYDRTMHQWTYDDGNRELVHLVDSDFEDDGVVDFGTITQWTWTGC